MNAKLSQRECGHDQRISLSREGRWTQNYLLLNGSAIATDSVHRPGNRWKVHCVECGLKAVGSYECLPDWAQAATELATRPLLPPE